VKISQGLTTIKSEKDKEFYTNRAIELAEEFDEVLSKFDNDEVHDWWEAYSNPDHAKLLRHYLASAHAGDCTAHPCSCMRCHAEEYYKVDPTAKWSKYEGWKLYQTAYPKSAK